MFQIKNLSNIDATSLLKMLEQFVPYAAEQLQFERPVNIVLLSDQTNSKNPLGKSGYYDPEEDTVGAFIDNRHPKDVCRSIAHELVHHLQNCEGRLTGDFGEGYAQTPDGDSLEREAYDGYKLFRDWEDQFKHSNENYANMLQETNNKKRFNRLTESFTRRK